MVTISDGGVDVHRLSNAAASQQGRDPDRNWDKLGTDKLLADGLSRVATDVLDTDPLPPAGGARAVA